MYAGVRKFFLENVSKTHRAILKWLPYPHPLAPPHPRASSRSPTSKIQTRFPKNTKVTKFTVSPPTHSSTRHRACAVFGRISPTKPYQWPLRTGKSKNSVPDTDRTLVCGNWTKIDFCEPKCNHSHDIWRLTTVVTQNDKNKAINTILVQIIIAIPVVG